MLSAFYTVIIFPLEEFIEVTWVFVYKVFRDPALAVLGVSTAVSVCTLPLYFIAEKYQQSEREIQKRLKPEIDTIKAVFSGDERYMILSTYYRQNHYHPIYALRSSLGLLIQIPFFIAAYSFLSNLDALRGVSFLFIKDLGAPDAILPLTGGGGGLSLNILPILMTLINCVAGAVYTKGLPVKEKIQIYCLALVFLILLYNSPAGLVLYWTMNNIFSLVKNCLYKIKNAKKIVYCVLCVCVIFFDIFLLFFHQGALIKRYLVASICSIVFLYPLFARFSMWIKRKINTESLWQHTGPGQGKIFIFSAVILSLLTGLVIPAAIISSSVQEFSFIDDHTSPLPFIGVTMFQAVGIFLFWPICFYILFSKKVKIILTVLMSVFSVISLVNTFIFPGAYGFLTPMIRFSNFTPPRFISAMANIIALFVVSALCLFLLIYRKKVFVYSFQLITMISLVGFGIINIVTIHTDYLEFAGRKEAKRSDFAIGPVYTFSQTGKNVLFIMLDRAISGYIPYIFDEKPELKSVFSGFTWYPNTIAFGGYTIFGAIGLYGGYEYTPLEMQKRPNETLVEKHNESLLVLPKLFLDNGYSVVVTDPPFANYSWVPDLHIFDGYPEIHAENIIAEKYFDSWMANRNLGITSISSILNSKLVRFSFFKIMPPVFRVIIYDNGNWLKTSVLFKESIPVSTIENYAALDILPEITAITGDDTNTLTMLANDLTHEPAFLQSPDYVPATNITDKGSGPFAHEEHYHVNIAALSSLGKWFTFLKENYVYDNTRIIIASDHGRNLYSNFPDNIILPDGTCLEAYTALLLVKDFNASGAPTADHSFMTNADAPSLAVKGVIPNPVNPFTHVPLRSNKENGVTIATSHVWDFERHGTYQFNIKSEEWLHVHTNIFDLANWKKVKQ
jgi:YidC/Oxa1 family membrane protein insertase